MKKKLTLLKMGTKISFASFWVWRKLKLVGQNLAKELIIFCTNKVWVIVKTWSTKKEKKKIVTQTQFWRKFCAEITQ